MSSEAVVMASDHAGVVLKAALKEELEGMGIEVLDLGPDGTESVDYPDYGQALATAIADGRAARGLPYVVQGSGSESL